MSESLALYTNTYVHNVINNYISETYSKAVGLYRLIFTDI